MDVYHGDCCIMPSVSSSNLRTLITKSPAHCFNESYLNPDKPEDEEKETYILGRAAHHLLLGEESFSTLFSVRPDDFKDWRTNASKEWRDGELSRGRTVLVPDQLDQIRGMARALAAHPMVQAGILNGDVERSLIHHDRKTGLYCKSRPDVIPTASGDFCDLKTTVSVGFDLDRDIGKYRYDMQAALCGICYRAIFEREMETFSFCFIEKKPPHCVEILTLKKEDIQAAEQDIRVALDVFAWCLEHKNWFGPGGTQRDARPVFMPSYVQQNSAARREFLMKEIATAEATEQQLENLATG